MKDINNYLAKDFSHICLSSTKALFLNSHEGNKEIRELAGKKKYIIGNGAFCDVREVPHKCWKEHKKDFTP